MDPVNNTELVTQLQRLWSIESMLVEAMPRMITKATALGLQKTLALHLAETDQHKVAVEAICKQLGIDASAGEPDTGLQRILQNGEKNMVATAPGDKLDVAIIESALQVEQYEMDAYQPVGNTAESAGHKGIAQRLRRTLEEERQSDTKLRFLQKSLFTQTAEIGQQEEAALKTY